MSEEIEKVLDRYKPTLRFFVTPADFCMGSLKEAMDLFPDGSKLKLLLSDSDIGTDVEIGIPVEFSSILPPDAWMLISDNEKGDIFYCPGT